MRAKRVKHEFVEFIPDDIAEGTIFISIPYATAVHLCICGCGHRVVTPLSPTDWCLIFDGDSVTLDPSIGNWSFPCESHYWIKRNGVVWARKWSKAKIDAGRARDRRAKRQYYGEVATAPDSPSAAGARSPGRVRRWLGCIRKLAASRRKAG